VERLEDRITPSILGVFELDANAATGTLGTSGSTTTSHDWDQVFNPGQFGSSSALATSFVTDKVNVNTDDIFTGGGSKDTQGIQAGRWLFTGGKPQGKDDITHAYAAAYTDPSNGHLILYAGMDRFDNSGDSTAGFWFFANTIGQNPNVTTNGGHPFTGTHHDGDILLVSDFTVGGSTSTIKVFKWSGDDATGSLVALNNGNPINGSTFAIVNSSAVGVPWSYTNKSGQSQPAAGEFLEEGVDLTALGLQGCFSTFLAETRSSQSPTATLSDFVIGSFPLCSLAAPQFSGISKVGDPVTYPLTVTNTGGMPLYIQSVSDTVLGNIVVNHTLQQPGAAGVNQFVTSITSGFNFSQALAPGASLTISVTRTVQPGDPDPTNSTVTFIGTDDLAGKADPITTSASNSVNLFQPSATLTVTASPTAAAVGTSIDYHYTMTNTSSADSPNLVLDTSNPNSSFTDTLLGDLEAAATAADGTNDGKLSLAPGASLSFDVFRTLQAGDPKPLTNSAEAIFTLAQNLGPFTNRIHAPSNVATVNVVDANISIAPDAVNKVGDPHTFTVTVNQVINGVSSPASGANVSVSLADSNGAVDVPSGLLSGTTDNNGQFSVTFTSQSAGIVTGNASATLSVLGVNLSRATGDGQSGDTGAAVKRFVDAKISIAPNATNGITEPHTFTVTVLQDDGLTASQGGDGVTGFAPVAGVKPTITLTGAGGASAINVVDTSSAGTDANGQCTATFTSDSPGTITGHATVTFNISGVSITRATDSTHGSSGDAVKTFVAGSLRWKKVDESGNLLGGATFVVTATGGTAASAGHTPLSVSVLDNGPLDADPTPGLFLLNAYQNFGGSALAGLALGTYAVQESVAPAGYTLDPNPQTATLTLAAPNADLSSTPFVDTLPHLAITKAVTPGFPTVIHPGDTASFTITVANTGAGTATNVVVTDALPDADMLSWSATSSAFTTSISAGVLTATDAALAGGTSASVTVSAVVPLDFFGTEGTGTGNGDPLPLDLFELDGNAQTGVLGTSGSTTTSHDWDQVFNDVTNLTTTSDALASAFVTDKVNVNTDDIFQGGGSKDTLGIQAGRWLFTGGKPQGKDDITHAYAATYKASNGDQILYAGMDRFDNSGDSTAGFWFFVNPIGENPGVTTNGGHPFTGTHHDGDILLVSDFTVGGSTSTIKVWKWVGDDATGSLVALNNGNPINGSTFAIVNSSAISVPWSYTNKSKQTQPAAGEFLEEGINLTALGLQGCFSTFLAETRSSQSPTATLSDFVLGSFNTCSVTLPNTAFVSASNFNNGQPISSNQVIITVNDGHALLAPSVTGGGRAESLTAQQLQSAVTQGMSAWRAAGIDAGTLSNLDQVRVYLADLPGAELGFTAGGEVWIDPTAAGWGWSTSPSPIPGRMDLVTVVTHELGHVLGFEHSATGVMDAVLTPGMRLVPEALTGTTSVVASAAPGGTGVSVGASPAVVHPSVAPSTPARAGTVEAGLAIGVRDTGALPAAGAIQDGSSNQRVLAGALLSVGQQPSPILLGTTTVTAAPAAEKPLDAGLRLVPALLPPTPRVEGGASPALPNDATEESDPVEWLVPKASPSDTPWGLETDAQASRRLQRSACDVCFADGSWRADPEDAGAPAPGVAAALAVLLGGYWGAQRKESEQRRRGFLS
jgi:uncharacterized repeat protein (TIGR01451 family)